MGEQSKFISKEAVDLHQENPVSETSQGIDLAVTVGEARAGGPFTHDRSAKTDQ